MPDYENVPHRVCAADVAGRWSFCDDGWLASLTLEPGGQGSPTEVTGILHSERFDDDYVVTGRVGVGGRRAVELTIHDYNWLDRQVFSGYLTTAGERSISGASLWQGTPYGFFASRAARILLGTYRDGPATASDFAGRWSAEVDGLAATVTIAAAADGESFSGTGALGPDRTPFRIDGHSIAGIPHGATLTFTHEDGTVREGPGYLASRPKGVVCGWTARPSDQSDRSDQSDQSDQWGLVMVRSS